MIFHNNHTKVKHPRPNQLRLLFTDSLDYDVQTNDIYKDMATDAADRYDFSEYPHLITLFMMHLTAKHLDSSKMN